MNEDKFEYRLNAFFYVLFDLLGIVAFIGAILYLRLDLLLLSAGCAGLSISFFLENQKTKKELKKFGGNSSRMDPDGKKEY